MSTPLKAFLHADVSEWIGLPRDVSVGSLEELTGNPGITLAGRAGDPATARDRVSLASSVFSEGLFAWLDPREPELGKVVALEGRLPLGTDGSALLAPNLAPPDAELDTVLGSLELQGGERVYADRGLTARINPDNGLLLGLIGFEPTDLETYRNFIRPAQGTLRHVSYGEGR